MGRDHSSYREIFKKKHGILRASTAMKLGVPKRAIYEMLDQGEIQREARGVYRLSEYPPLGNPDLVQVSLRIPKGVIFLLSALYIYRLTSQIPRQVHLAVPQGVKAPRLDYPPIRVFHLSKGPYLAGIQPVQLDGVEVPVYREEKTIADCFKYRSRFGVDLGIEALREYMRRPSRDVALLMRYAKIDRVERALRPYVEALA